MPINFFKRAALYALFGVILSLTFSISLYEAASVTLVVCALWAMALEKDFRAFRGPWMIFVLIYFAANLLSLAHSQYMPDSLKGITRVLRLILLAVSVVYIVDSEEKFKKVFWLCLATAFIIGIDGLVQGLSGFEMIRQRVVTAYVPGAARISSSFPHPNDFSAYLTLMLFFFVGILLESRRLKLPPKITSFLAVGTAMLSACLLWTYCRGAWVAVGASLVLLALFKRKKSVFLLLVLITAWMMFFSPASLRGRFQSLFDSKNGSITERKVLMQESVEMIKKNPWTGFGLNTFSDNAPFYKSREHRTDVQYAHNGYLQMTVETGLVGLAAFLSMLFCFFCVTLPLFLKKEVGWLEAGGSAAVFGVLAFLLHSYTDTNLHSLLLVSNLWLCMGLAMAAAGILERQKR